MEQYTEQNLEDEQLESKSDDGTVTLYYPDVFQKPRGVYRLMQIKTIRAVQKGDPLTISYIDTSLPVAARRQRLRDDYYFDCECDRCLRELQSKVKKK